MTQPTLTPTLTYSHTISQIDLIKANTLSKGVGSMLTYLLCDSGIADINAEVLTYTECLYYLLRRDITYNKILSELNLTDKYSQEYCFDVYTDGVSNLEYIVPLLKTYSMENPASYITVFYQELAFPYLAYFVLPGLLKLDPNRYSTNRNCGRPDAVVLLDRGDVNTHYKEFSRQRRCVNKNTNVESSYLDTATLKRFTCGDFIKVEIENLIYFLNKDYKDKLTNVIPFNYETQSINNYCALQNVIRLLKFNHSPFSEFIVLSDNFELLGYTELQKKDTTEVFWVNSVLRRDSCFDKRSLGNYFLYDTFKRAYEQDVTYLNLGINAFDYKQEYKPMIIQQPGITITE